MVLVRVGRFILALTKCEITAPANLVWSVRIIEAIGEEMKKGGGVSFDAVFVFGISLAEIAVTLHMLGIQIPVLPAGAILKLPGAFVSDE